MSMIFRQRLGPGPGVPRGGEYPNGEWGGIGREVLLAQGGALTLCGVPLLVGAGPLYDPFLGTVLPTCGGALMRGVSPPGSGGRYSSAYTTVNAGGWASL